MFISLLFYSCYLVDYKRTFGICDLNNKAIRMACITQWGNIGSADKTLHDLCAAVWNIIFL